MSVEVKTVLITGASGFVGQKAVEKLSSRYRVVAFDKRPPDSKFCNNLISVSGDITDENKIKGVCQKHQPDIIVHCAGIAHQKITRPLDEDTYNITNHIATKRLAAAAVNTNSDIHFVFLSSVSVYGEKYNDSEAGEEDPCYPTTAYARSKLNAEKSLIDLFDAGLISKVDILRLAPVYDRSWSLNLDRRVFGPQKMCYLKFGSGNQKMSVLARSNLIDFIGYRVNQTDSTTFCKGFNVCDRHPCSFNDIITVFRNSTYQPNRPVIKIPLEWIGLGARISGRLIQNRSAWFQSCYDKLANSLVFDNSKMLESGFVPVHTLKSVFS